MSYPLIGMPQGAEWLVILAIVILVFGAAKLPDLARGTGQALRIFKSETKGLKDDEEGRGEAGPQRHRDTPCRARARPRRRARRHRPPARHTQRLTAAAPSLAPVSLSGVVQLFVGRPVHPVVPMAGWRCRTTCASSALGS